MSDNGNLNSQRRALMLNTPIHKLIPKMAVPTVVAMLITAIYNMADAYFVSYLGTSATAAVGVNAAIDQIIMMGGSFLAIGANSYISRLLGAKQNDKASATLSNAFFTALAMGLLIVVSGLAFIKPLVLLLGATETSLKYSMDYASYIIIAAPFMTTSFVLNQCLRSEGSPVYSMLGLVSGKREYKWISSKYLVLPESFQKYRVIIAETNNTGVLGETLSSPLIGVPYIAHTDTFLTVGAFDTEAEANAVLKYIKTKFARLLLGVLKITQHNSRATWQKVPLQDFTPQSDIDWTQPIPDIDRQLYAKYGLDEKEIAFIEEKVRAME